MTKVKFLKVQFTDTIQPWELPAFRGAVVAKVGRAHHWFHNHLDDKQYLYRYPKIQYKCVSRHPMLLCLEEGVEEIHKLFEKSDWSLNISQRDLEMRIHRLDLHEFTMQVLDRPQTYRIRNWVALNEKNYATYQHITALTDKIAFLEQKLVSHIISFAKGIRWHIDQRFEVKITELSAPRWVKVKSTGLMGFDVSFTTRIFLPDFVGLGRKVSLGFGTVRRERKENYSKVT